MRKSIAKGLGKKQKPDFAPPVWEKDKGACPCSSGRRYTVGGLSMLLGIDGRELLPSINNSSTGRAEREHIDRLLACHACITVLALLPPWCPSGQLWCVLARCVAGTLRGWHAAPMQVVSVMASPDNPKTTCKALWHFALNSCCQPTWSCAVLLSAAAQSIVIGDRILAAVLLLA